MQYIMSIFKNIEQKMFSNFAFEVVKKVSVLQEK